MFTDTTTGRAAGLREWAHGIDTSEAAAELLIRAVGGKLLHGPWIQPRDDAGVGWWFDTTQINTDDGPSLSSGEHRLLEIAGSVADTGHPVNLGDAVAGLDRPTLELVLAAIAHAGGSHHHSAIRYDPDGQPTGIQHLATAYPWPDNDQPARAETQLQ
jgi:hypothetical protein